MSSLSRPQRLGDGVLEFVTFSSAASMGFERMSVRQCRFNASYSFSRQHIGCRVNYSRRSMAAGKKSRRDADLFIYTFMTFRVIVAFIFKLTASFI